MNHGYISFYLTFLNFFDQLIFEYIKKTNEAKSGNYLTLSEFNIIIIKYLLSIYDGNGR